MTAYPKPAAGPPKFPALETEVLDYWDSDDTFRRLFGEEFAGEYERQLGVLKRGRSAT